MKPLLLMVVGCHRSGTSAVAGALANLGWHLGPDLMPPSPDNPRGYYESMPLVRLHDALLHRMGRTWDTAERVQAPWMKSWSAKFGLTSARLLLQRCIDGAKSNALALKDPRLCMFRLLWQEACAAEGLELKALLVHRNEHSIVQSLCSRDKFTVEHAKDVVHNHQAGMNDWHEHVPWAVVDYEHMLVDWHMELRHAFQCLGLPVADKGTAPARAVDAYLNPELDHHGNG